jgi:hypothetical protein
MWQVVNIIRTIGKAEAMPRRIEVRKCSQDNFHFMPEPASEPLADMGPRFVQGLVKGDEGNQPADWRGVWF